MNCYRCHSTRMLPAFCEMCYRYGSGGADLRQAVMRAYHERVCDTICDCQPFVDLAIPAEHAQMESEKEEAQT